MTTAEKVADLIAKKKTGNHILHAVLSVVTFGLWFIVWLAVFANVSQHNNKIDDQIKNS